ncbi:MAG: cohesin domain-containing protein, partial [Candidatus Nanoarchaeia archaeon]
MRRLLVPLFLIALLFSLVPVVSTPSSLTGTVVRFDPATVELGPYFCVNDTFTLKARVDNVEDLLGFEFEIAWNTTYLEYVDHIAKVPVEVYADGLIHEPVMWIKDEVNASEGWYWVAVTTLGGPSFNGSGIAFEITFSVKYQPVDPEPDVNFMVEFIEA